MAIVYRAFDSSNGKSYIGQTWRDVKRRRWEHETCGRNDPFHNALSVRPEKFEWTILAETHSQERLDELECSFIGEFNSLFPDGYNMKDGGYRGRHTDESKRKISLANAGNKKRLGKSFTKESRDKIRNTLKAKGIKPPSRAGSVPWNKGKGIARSSRILHGKKKVEEKSAVEPTDIIP